MDQETRETLIVRLADSSATAAWGEFVRLYRPLIVKVARMKGLQVADAEDLAQEVLRNVARSIDSFTPGPVGSFRGWLRTITRNLIINHLTRNKGPVGSGDSQMHEFLQQVPSTDDQTGTLFDLEQRRMAFQVAARKIKSEFSEAIWQAFWLTAVEGETIREIASRLGKSEGSIRMARSRVMMRLREEVARMES